MRLWLTREATVGDETPHLANEKRYESPAQQNNDRKQCVAFRLYRFRADRKASK